jgi:hypothetical protein
LIFLILAGKRRALPDALYLEFTLRNAAGCQGAAINKGAGVDLSLGCFVLSMSSASTSEEAKSKKQKDIEDYLSKIKLREVFQVIFLLIQENYWSLCIPTSKEFCTEGLLGRHALCMLGRTLAMFKVAVPLCKHKEEWACTYSCNEIKPMQTPTKYSPNFFVGGSCRELAP